MFRLEDPESDDHCLSQVEERIREDIEKIMVDDDEEVEKVPQEQPSLSNSIKEFEAPLEPQYSVPEITVIPPATPVLPVTNVAPAIATVDMDAPCQWILAFAYEHKLRPMEIYNLFSNFGDINKVIVRKHTAVV